VLLLDEPYTGLDRQAAKMLDSVLRDVGVGSRTAILTTHNLERGVTVSHRAAILMNGKVTYQMNNEDWDPDRFRREYERQTTGGGTVG